MDDFFSDGEFFNGPFGADPFMNHFFGERAAEIQRTNDSRTQPSHAGPVIEELNEEDDDQSSIEARSENGQDNTDSFPEPGESGEQTRSTRNRQSSSGVNNRSQLATPFQFYSSTTTTTMSNGMSEITSTHRDSTGVERISVERRIGDRGHTVVRERDAAGIERRSSAFENITEDDAPDFDRSWRSAVAHNQATCPPLLSSSSVPLLTSGPSVNENSSHDDSSRDKSIDHSQYASHDRNALSRIQSSHSTSSLRSPSPRSPPARPKNSPSSYSQRASSSMNTPYGSSNHLGKRPGHPGSSAVGPMRQGPQSHNGNSR
eukprot:CAMPEP_0184662030 /NCGR_PEP_ID=MMETSP0308-20130426/41217_1 /TAXON_ID=38269 /ORGANISM="Gloeochaete witrockiana, Strain SAG 46.84" /LENGTH=316 /DNA_ID=CAMNT_0027103745 /DNA_START=230 /DNA_END=1180 /DNA_ORIENTATION=+